jgi:hypothetical protein
MTTKELPDDWWNHGINPILGYKYEPMTKPTPPRNKNEYRPEDDYNPNTEDNG